MSKNGGKGPRRRMKQRLAVCVGQAYVAAEQALKPARARVARRKVVVEDRTGGRIKTRTIHV